MKEIREKIFTAVGKAGMCWKPIPKGVFDSTKAGKVGDRLTAEIEKIMNGEYKSGYHDALNGRPFRKDM